MNHVCLTGRISSKELVIEKVGKAKDISKCVFNLAVTREYKNAEGKYDADFPRLVAWKGTADYLQKYAQKGTMLEVEGKIQTGSYQGSDGKTVYTTDVVVEKAKIIAGGKSSNAQQHEEPESTVDDISDYADVDISDEDLPY